MNNQRKDEAMKITIVEAEAAELIENDVEVGSYYINPNVIGTIYRRVAVDSSPVGFFFTTSNSNHARVVVGVGLFPAIPCDADGNIEAAGVEKVVIGTLSEGESYFDAASNLCVVAGSGGNGQWVNNLTFWRNGSVSSECGSANLKRTPCTIEKIVVRMGVES
jgi:hypothetical protein